SEFHKIKQIFFADGIQLAVFKYPIEDFAFNVNRFFNDFSDIVDGFLVEIIRVFLLDFIDNINSGIGVNLLINRCPGNDIADVFHRSFESSKRQNNGKLAEQRNVLNQNRKQNQ